MERFDYENVKESVDSRKVIAGGYIAKICNVKDVKDKQYLEIELDIANGEYEKYYESLYSQKGFWALRHYASYKEQARGMFKHFIECVKKSNAGYEWGFDENTLIGKKVGLVLGYEEYRGIDGNVKQKVRIDKIKSVEEIQKGEFDIPALKEMKEEDKFTNQIDDSDLPF